MIEETRYKHLIACDDPLALTYRWSVHGRALIALYDLLLKTTIAYHAEQFLIPFLLLFMSLFTREKGQGRQDHGCYHRDCVDWNWASPTCFPSRPRCSLSLSPPTNSLKSTSSLQMTASSAVHACVFAFRHFYLGSTDWVIGNGMRGSF